MIDNKENVQSHSSKYDAQSQPKVRFCHCYTYPVQVFNMHLIINLTH